MPATPPQPALRQTLHEGSATAHLLRAGPVAAQLLLSTEPVPRLLVAHAAGNSGAALWFEPLDAPVQWRLVGEVQPVTAADAQGRPLHGVEAELEIAAPELRLRHGLVGSVRVLRDHQFDGRLPAHGLVAPQVGSGMAIWSRDRLDGEAGHALSLHVSAGTSLVQDGDGLRLEGYGPLRLRLRALTGEMPLTPLAAELLLTGHAADLPRARQCLSFLAFREKWLAGSWRFQTYFGRDTLMSLRLLLPVLRPEAAGAALDSVLARLSPAGEVAHEEDIGEFVVAERLHRGERGPGLDAPLYDYKMVDDDFMLLPVATAWLLDTADGRAQAHAYLAGEIGPGFTRAAALARNFAFVLARARPFADRPDPRRLVALKLGSTVGDWRDSEVGLGHGRYAYSVNAALVPAALHAALALRDSGLIDAELHAGVDASDLGALSRMAEVWREQAPRCFEFSVPADVAGNALALAAAELGLPGPAAPTAPLALHALALDAAGRPLPLQHSDFGFSLLLDEPAPERIAAELAPLLQPYPLGLMTGVGLLVANATFAPAALRAEFGPDRYHGAVVWSWQQAMMAAGIARQRTRADLPASVQQLLARAHERLWQAIDATHDVANSELWSWRHVPGQGEEVQAFGPLCATADESNAAQLWSTVYLAVQQ